MTLTAIENGRIFDGEIWRDGQALLISDGRFEGIRPAGESPREADVIDAQGGVIAPGFIDLQVNGGGGVMFNDDQSVEGIRTICEAHARFGTTALLPTLITDTPEITAAAIEAGLQAKAEHVPGFLGLHLEGPHLSTARKGAHDPSLIRPMTEEDLTRLESVGQRFDAIMITIAPENVTEDQVTRLKAAGFTVSLGHTNASYETAGKYADAGASCATHLFNAMSQMENRSPGLVGAALDIGALNAGIIADGFHVHKGTMSAALRAKRGPGHIFVVTDAMSTIGTDLSGFTLNGRQIYRTEGKLTLADGTLAGADIDMFSSVRFLIEIVGLPFEEAVRMASLYPANVMGVSDRKGRIAAGYDADFVILSADAAHLTSTWIGGSCVHVT
ncbi:N-acetylglucosamine-6-phosphate deacetylase [Rhizobium sp. SG_E_25_P2]|uniref:N-acetylglucosamine-6-phosphate deacetylase n=1 Tax=Rhizobium sp. SG_E_25_P2 TaxID=2879942 RepID=UPI002474723F|nr:N-acetylglucosamine-6-phosphate deacetylase [Rhizobium sp. SG_E_25_P2]MDH6264651.1 N-acetylglucosamine-6-phosphate deacetylase [Rhizobium sp. SG_E_25_P2]